MRDAALDRLFTRFRDRSDGAALAAVFDATSRELFEVACHLVRDPTEAEDLVQTTFLTAIRKKELYDRRSPLRGWLYGILWREGAKSRRSALRRVDPRELPDREEPDPLDLAAAEELPAAVEHALARLPERYREVLDPLIRDSKQPDEIARDLRRSPGTVRSQIHRGLERLRRSLPHGLAPAHGLAAISVQGLTRIRGEVLRTAGVPAATIAAPAGGLALGGVLMSKTVLFGTAAAAAMVIGAWVTVDRSSAADAEASAPDRVPVIDASARTANAQGAKSDVRAAPSDRSSAGEADRAVASSAQPASQDAVQFWLARFAEKPDDWRHGLAVATEIAKLSPEEALRIMTAVWPHLTVPVKEQALKPFVDDGAYEHALKILDLAARDSALSVQARAFHYLRAYAFRDFAADFDAYGRWAQTFVDRPLSDVLTESARRLVGDMMALPPEEIGKRVCALDRLDLHVGDRVGLDLRATIRNEGGLRILEACMQLDDVGARSAALNWSKTIGADEGWLRTWVLPAVEQPESVDPNVVSRAVAALGRPDCAWARESILTYLRRCAEGGTQGASAAARSLADIGDPAAIPGMIEVLLHDKSGKLTYDVGYHGLAKLTGVNWQDSYDGAWWLDWWEKNRMRLPAAVRDTAIRR